MVGSEGTTSTDGHDTINGAMVQDNVGVNNQTFEDADEIDGGDGEDTLSVTLDANVAAIVSNVEHLIVRNLNTAPGSINVDMVGFDDSIETITVRDTAAGSDTIFFNVQSAASLALVNVNAAVVVDYDTDVLGSDAAIFTLTVDGSTANLEVNLLGEDVITSLAIDVVSDSAITLLAASDFETVETVTITGAGDLELIDGAGTTEFAAITEVDASDLVGGLTMDLTSAAAAVTFTGGSGDDVVTTSGDDDEISTGAGDDEITVALAGDVTVDAGAGDDTVIITAGGLDDADTIDGGAGTNTIDVDADDLDALETAFVTDENVTNFTALAISGAAAAAVTFDALSTGITDISVDADLAFALSIDNLSDGTLTVTIDQTAELEVLSVGAADSVEVIFAEATAGATITVAALTLTDVETVSIVADTDEDVTFTAIDLDGTTSLTLSGAGTIEVTALTADSLETVDLSDFTGTITSVAGVSGLDLETSDGVELIIGNLAAAATFILDATNTADDTITFADADLDVAITIVDFNAGLGNDKIDLSVFGITSLSDADLDISDDGADTTIAFDGIDGTIILDGVLTTDLDASNFIFA